MTTTAVERVPAQRHGVGQRATTRPDHQLLRIHPLRQHLLQKCLALCNGKGIGFAGGPEYDHAVTPLPQEIAHMVCGTSRVDGQIGIESGQARRPYASEDFGLLVHGCHPALNVLDNQVSRIRASCSSGFQSRISSTPGVCRTQGIVARRVGACIWALTPAGTFTDAVLVDPVSGVMASAKALTTHNQLIRGIREGVRQLIEQCPDAAASIELVSISTTLATNAVVEGKRRPVCLLLIGQPRSALERAGLGRALGNDPVVFVDGGHRATGEERMPLDAAAIGAAMRRVGREIEAVAVSGLFSVRNPGHEQCARDLIREFTNLPVSCGHELSSHLDAPRRSLTALLNARLIPLIDELIHAARSLLREMQIDAPLTVVRGDGSLISAEAALLRPIETILSGPAASVVGARHLTEERDALVVDMGGTTTDIAVLRDGSPRRSTSGAMVGSWRTMVEAIDIRTVGLGGDSEVVLDADGDITLAPRRAVPLSLAATRHPEIVAMLQSQLEQPPSEWHGVFALGEANDSARRGALSNLERTILSELKAGPAALADLFEDPRLPRPLERLRERGVITVSAFTPSDAAHVLGSYDRWSAHAARLGAQTWVRRLRCTTAGAPYTTESLAAAVIDCVVAAAARVVIAAALAETDGLELSNGDHVGQWLLGNATEADRRPDRLLDVSIRLNQPLIAIGAPAPAYYPRVAGLLATRVVVPPHAPVCNAVGAVASSVTQRVRILITAPNEALYRVHSVAGIHDFDELEAATAHAAQAATAEAQSLARDQGGEHIEVDLARQDTVVTDPRGRPVFLESVVTATAAGRPRVKTRDSQPHRPSPIPDDR